MQLFTGRCSVCCLALIAWFTVPALSVAEDWPTFRGPERTSVSKDTGLLKEWPKEGPPVVWKVDTTGRGYSSLAIVGDHIYTLGDNLTEEDKDEYLICLNRETGAPVWKTKTGAPWNSGKADWQGSRSTPTVDGALVYVLTPAGELVCCESATGTEKWRKNLKNDFSGKKGDSWGYSESVTIDGDNLICTPGGETNTMVALNKLDGELKWKTVVEKDRGAGHSSVVKSEIGGTKVLVQMTGSGAMGVRAADGELLWTFGIEKTTAVIPTPIVRGDLVFFAVGYKRGGALLQQEPAADGKVTIKEIYGVTPALANKHGGVVLVGDYVYGDSDDQGIPYCAELMTGKIAWKKRGTGKGSASVIAADGCIYVHYASGVLALAKATEEDYTEISSFEVPGSGGDMPSWTHPVIVGGKLYVRELNTLLCYDLRDPSKVAQATER